MTKVSVWSPNSSRVELVIEDQLEPMIQDAFGWWHTKDSALTHGVDYAFLVDGHGPFPDPRSAWQPNGIHGPSRWVDHALFEWCDQNWQPPALEKAIIYELHIGTFTEEGTFDATIERLDYLVELGITHVELMPVAEFSGNHGWGYDGVNLFAPHHAYGGPDGLKRLINACHQRGLAVLLDVVYNHLGPCGNYLGQFAPYFTKRHVTPWGEAVNLDGAHSDEVRRFFIDNALMWLRDYHFDGLRLDAVHAIVDMSATHFLEQLAIETRMLENKLGRPLVLIAESDLNDPRLIHSQSMGGYGLDAQWNEDFHHALHTVLTGENNGYYQDFGRLADLAKAITEGFVYDGRYSSYRKRSHGRSAIGLSGHKFVACLQNHDQTGNRAQGERTSHLLSPEKLMIGATLVLMAPFIPMLFQGEEWGALTPFLYFTDHQESDLAEAVRRGRQEEFATFGWPQDTIPDPQAPETFQRSKLDWQEMVQARHRTLLDWHRQLIQLRHALPMLEDGHLEQTSVHFDEEKRWLVMAHGSAIVACNLSDIAQSIPYQIQPGLRISLASVEGVTVEERDISMPAQSVAIFS